MNNLQLFTVLAPLAFAVGFALQRGNVCSVLAARQIVWMGRWTRLRGLLLASAWGFAILIPLTWLDVGPFKLSQQYPPTLLTAFAGVLYAFGCFVNGACIFGVCSRMTAGHISFIFSIPAMSIGAALGGHTPLAPQPSALAPTVAASHGPILLGIWGLVTLWLVWTAIRMVRAHWRAGVTFSNILRQSRWRSGMAALIIGVLGSILFATDTAWFYPAMAKRLTVYAAGLTASVPLDSIVGGLALFLGSIVAARFKGRMVVRPPHLRPSIQAFVGGLIIGFAWSMIPGGNDAMVLYLLPSLAIHGLIAYATMLLTLVGIEYLKRRGTLSTYS